MRPAQGAYGAPPPAAIVGLAPTIAEVAAPTATYIIKPSDYFVVLNLSGYPGAGPTIRFATPVDYYPVCVRNVAGDASAHPITVAAPVGCTLEDPASPGTFAPTIVMRVPFSTGLWAFERPSRRLILCPPAPPAAGPIPLIFKTVVEFTIPPMVNTQTRYVRANVAGADVGDAIVATLPPALFGSYLQGQELVVEDGVVGFGLTAQDDFPDPTIAAVAVVVIKSP